MQIGTFLRHRRVGWSLGFAFGFLSLFGASVNASADDTSPHRAGRLSYIQGSVTVDRMDNTGSDPAVVNMPIAAGVRLSTGDDGQAEVEFEDGSLLRLTPNSSLSLNALSVDAGGNFQTQIDLLQGLMYAELRAAAKYQYSIDADGDVISPVANATVRINLDQPPAAISVLDGTVHVERADSPDATGYHTDVRSGETMTRDSADPSRYFLSQQIAPETWDQWNESRDQAAADDAASRTAARDSYAGDQGYGWSDLDANGTWYDVPGEGKVWQPTVAVDAGFDPYGYGSWVYYPGSGYVWASGYGWGWTPYRCGNWSYWTGFGWGWLPGSGCGLASWGFASPGGYVINVIRPPANYIFIQRPVHGPGTVHPIHVGHPIHPIPLTEQPYHGPRAIAGQRVEPLHPVSTYTPREGTAVGASLRRDYPVDQSSHQPVMGVTPAPGTTPHGDWRSGASRPVTPPAGGAYPASRTQSSQPPPYRPAPVYRQPPPPPAQSHPAPANHPAPAKSAPAQAKPN